MIPDYASIGAGTYFADITFHRWGAEKIVIGKYCSISQGVKLLAGGNHRTDTITTYPFDALSGKVTGSAEDRCYERGSGVHVGNDVWIGFGATIIGNVHVGDGAVIAANATVFSDIPPYMIAVGNPARALKPRFSEEITEALLRIAWWDWPEEMIRENIDAFYLPIDEFVYKFEGAFA